VKKMLDGFVILWDLMTTSYSWWDAYIACIMGVSDEGFVM